MTASVSPDAWTCPVCLELLFKPCVNHCGHVFCFWCSHQSMSPYSSSKCPLCREGYSHLPRVCTLLNSFLKQAFPQQYAERGRETQAIEEQRSVFASDVDELLPEPSSLSPVDPSMEPKTRWQPSDFACSNPRCRQLLHEPVVLTCGHVVCGSTCKPQSQQAGRPAQCALCSLPVPSSPTLCKQLETLLQSFFPAELQVRQQQVAAELARRQAAGEATAQTSSVPGAPPDAASKSDAASTSQQDQGHVQSLSEASSAAARRVQESAAALAVLVELFNGSGSTAGPAAPLPGIPSLEGTALEAMRSRIKDNFMHLHVGCDSCGVMPITGRRYRCMDCPDTIGFDLCGACHDAGLHIYGRFNQRHVPEHRMELVAPKPRLMHILQAVNPELSMPQIMALMHFSLDDDEAELIDPASLELASMEHMDVGPRGEVRARHARLALERRSPWGEVRRRAVLGRPRSGTPRPDTSPRRPAHSDASEDEEPGTPGARQWWRSALPPPRLEHIDVAPFAMHQHSGDLALPAALGGAGSEASTSGFFDDLLLGTDDAEPAAAGGDQLGGAEGASIALQARSDAGWAAGGFQTPRASAMQAGDGGAGQAANGAPPGLAPRTPTGRSTPAEQQQQRGNRVVNMMRTLWGAISPRSRSRNSRSRSSLDASR